MLVLLVGFGVLLVVFGILIFCNVKNPTPEENYEEETEGSYQKIDN